MEKRAAKRLALAKPELKWLDTEISNVTVDTSWEHYEDLTKKCLSAVPQGNADSERVGSQIIIKSISVRGLLVQPSGIDTLKPKFDTLVRLQLVQDTQTNGTQLFAPDVMQATASALLEIASYRNLAQSGKFKVLSNTMVQVVPNSTSKGGGGASSFANPQLLSPFMINVDFLSGIEVNFSGSGGTISDVVDNSIHLIATAVGTETLSAVLSYVSRIRYF